MSSSAERIVTEAIRAGDQASAPRQTRGLYPQSDRIVFHASHVALSGAEEVMPSETGMRMQSCGVLRSSNLRGRRAQQTVT